MSIFISTRMLHFYQTPLKSLCFRTHHDSVSEGKHYFSRSREDSEGTFRGFLRIFLQPKPATKEFSPNEGIFQPCPRAARGNIGRELRWLPYGRPRHVIPTVQTVSSTAYCTVQFRACLTVDLCTGDALQGGVLRTSFCAAVRWPRCAAETAQHAGFACHQAIPIRHLRTSSPF